MAEPTSMILPLAAAGAGGGVAIAVGLDHYALVAAFAGAVMFAFMSKGTPIAVKAGLALAAWVFGYFLGMEVVSREFWGFKAPSLPAFVSAFFCVAVFKLVLAIFDEDGKAWIRKKLGLSTEGPKDE